MVGSVDECTDIVTHTRLSDRVPRRHRWSTCAAVRIGSCDNVFATDERAGEPRPELVEFIGAVAEAMVIGDIVKELLSVKGSTEEESKATVCGFNDVCDFINGLATIERILVREAVLNTLRGSYAGLERLGDTTQERWVDYRRPSVANCLTMRIRGW